MIYMRVSSLKKYSLSSLIFFVVKISSDLSEMSGDPLKGCEDILADGSPPRESSAQNITIPSIRVDQLSVNESSHGFIILKIIMIVM